MSLRRTETLWASILLVFLGTNLGNKANSAAPPSAIPAVPAPVAAAAGTQVLTRGPVHEAFAETVTFDPQPGILAPKAPPAAIEELPPAQKPQGANVAWIPGYWGWDDERNDFLWVSGVWRDLPPGRQWVPGYWGKSALGSQWTSGYWADAKATEVQYLSEPPATAETGPNVAAPSADSIWLPGCWIWNQNRYAWRPGFWARRSRIGIGSLRITSGPRAATSLLTATGITPWPVAAYFLRGLFQRRRLFAARFLVFAGNGD